MITHIIITFKHLLPPLSHTLPGMQTPMPQQPPTNTFHEFTTEQLLNATQGLATQGLARSEATAGAYGALGGIPGLSQLEQQHRLQQQQQQQRVAAAAAAAAAAADPQLPLWEQHVRSWSGPSRGPSFCLPVCVCLFVHLSVSVWLILIMYW